MLRPKSTLVTVVNALGASLHGSMFRAFAENARNGSMFGVFADDAMNISMLECVTYNARYLSLSFHTSTLHMSSRKAKRWGGDGSGVSVTRYSRLLSGRCTNSARS